MHWTVIVPLWSSLSSTRLDLTDAIEGEPDGCGVIDFRHTECVGFLDTRGGGDGVSVVNCCGVADFIPLINEFGLFRGAPHPTFMSFHVTLGSETGFRNFSNS